MEDALHVFYTRRRRVFAESSLACYGYRCTLIPFYAALRGMRREMRNMTTEARRRASAKYDRENTRRVSIKLNVNTDRELLDYLSTLSNVQGHIKSLLRLDMLAQGQARRDESAPGASLTHSEALQAVVAALLFGEAGIGIAAAQEKGPGLHVGSGATCYVSQTSRRLLAEAEAVLDERARELGREQGYGRSSWELRAL